jgi:hypothetical protein
LSLLPDAVNEILNGEWEKSSCRLRDAVCM